jgi:hypothetical protein
LQQLGLLSSVEATPLAAWLRPQIRNLKDLPTGEVRPAVRLVKI